MLANEKKGSELWQFDTLRYLCALYVFVFHVHVRWPITSVSSISNLYDVGAIGMTFFFMLSGYVLAYRYSGEVFNNRDFVLRRSARLLPNYLLGSVLTIPFIKTDNPLLLLGLILTFLTVSQSIFTTYFNYWNFGASWSISVEYIICFISRYLLAIHASVKNFLLSLLALVVIAIVSSCQTPDVAFPFYYASFISRIPEFVLGVIAFKLRTHRRSGFAAVILVALLLLIIALFGNIRSNYLVYSPLVACASFVILLCAKDTSSFFCRALNIKIFRYITRSAYSFYTLQAFSIFLFEAYEKDVIRITQLPKHLYVFPIFIFLFVLSNVVYRLYEEPLRAKINQLV